MPELRAYCYGFVMERGRFSQNVAEASQTWVFHTSTRKYMFNAGQNAIIKF